ncbi:putative UDP-rhamnose:rhamnosyltransferase 1 [Papaver somniferum]|uniref:putative UDP-rhamnose:rhamnosyltransferase 1 n=1 Tax=Papaver somniferum TaxID=3469 RepID=UPI000E6FDF86|nr:putative UDP-rhamnose:rhamnosyltransferase 1 [Papaver somniferum]
MATKNQDEDHPLHIVMVPWLAFGHLIPFLELSKSLAKMGHRISFISTPRNIQRLVKNQSSSPFINFISIPLAKDENLRDQAEATIDLPLDEVPYLKKAYDSLEGPVSIFLETSRPDWIIYDFAPHWLPPVASRLDIPCCFFSIFNASVNCFFGPPSRHTESDIDDSVSRNRKTLEDFTATPSWIPFPTNLAFRMHEIRKVFGSIQINVSGVSDGRRFACTIQGSEVVAIRSCMEFESEHVGLLEKLFEKPIVPVGLLPPPSPDVNDEDDKHEEWMRMREWLDKHEQKSVVYIALGTEAALSKEETSELALGLELSNIPFFWVLRKPTGSNDDPSSMLPKGFEERTKGKGFMCFSWAPQMRILGHPSLGGFMTHCGWSSVIEALEFGCPLILLPVINDQALNARTLVWKQVGLEIERDEEDGSFTREAVAKSLRTVMVDEEGEMYRAKVKEMRQVFGNKSLHDGYVERFSQYLKEHKRDKLVKN